MHARRAPLIFCHLLIYLFHETSIGPLGHFPIFFNSFVKLLSWKYDYCTSLRTPEQPLQWVHTVALLTLDKYSQPFQVNTSRRTTGHSESTMKIQKPWYLNSCQTNVFIINSPWRLYLVGVVVTRNSRHQLFYRVISENVGSLLSEKTNTEEYFGI